MSSALGGMECALSFIPLTGAAQCAFGVARGGLSVMRDAPTGDGADAAIGVGAGVAGAGAACAKGAIQEVPLLGSAISCGAAGVSIVKNCTCAFRETAPQQTALFANEERSPQSALQDAFVAGLEARIALLEARRSYYTTLLGDPIWTQAAELEDGDPFRAMNQIAGLVTEAALAAQAGTDEEQIISQMEADQIRSLPRPSTIGEEDVNALVDYLNRTTEMWRQGLLTHAEAGRSDFMDHDDYLP